MDMQFFETVLTGGDRVCGLWLRRSSQAVNAADWLAAHGVEVAFRHCGGWYKTEWIAEPGTEALTERLHNHQRRKQEAEQTA